MAYLGINSLVGITASCTSLMYVFCHLSVIFIFQPRTPCFASYSCPASFTSFGLFCQNQKLTTILFFPCITWFVCVWWIRFMGCRHCRYYRKTSAVLIPRYLRIDVFFFSPSPFNVADATSCRAPAMRNNASRCDLCSCYGASTKYTIW